MGTVVGGHAGVTILPLFSQDPISATIDAAKIPDLDTKVQNAGTEVVTAKNGKGSATLSMAYAGSRFGKAILAGLTGKETTECCYLESTAKDGMNYFSSKVVFGKGGVKEILPLGAMNEHETKRLEEACVALKDEIETGMKYAEANT